MSLQATIKDTKVGVGDRVRVHQKIIEGDKVRKQIFEGVVISIRGREENKSFTVRRIASGNIGVERIWPVASPWIEKMEIVKSGRVRRAKLYYLRQRRGRLASRVKTKQEKAKNVEENKKKAIQAEPKKAAKSSSSSRSKAKSGKNRGKSGRRSSEKK